MRNVLGNLITLTLFGESHGPCIGGVLDGLPAGLEIDNEYIKRELDKRKSIAALSTPRREADEPEFLSGVMNGRTEGTPVAFTIANTNVHSSDYDELRNVARPGHADYSAEMRYGGFQDARGGGHFSGRLTAALVTAGAILRKALEDKGIIIATHIYELAGIRDADFDMQDPASCAASLNEKAFATISAEAEEKMTAEIKKARAEGDSVGGILETVVLGLPAGVGEPSFGSMESEISSAVFSIGAVKGIEFGAGFDIARMKGSEANDVFAIEDGRVVTRSNNNGGINGGITNGMPLVFRTAVKPTPSISKKQSTVDFSEMKEIQVEIKGRHDPAVVHRARACVDAAASLVIADMLCLRYGSDFLRAEEVNAGCGR